MKLLGISSLGVYGFKVYVSGFFSPFDVKLLGISSLGFRVFRVFTVQGSSAR